MGYGNSDSWRDSGSWMLSWNLTAGPVAASTSMPISACLNSLSKYPQTGHLAQVLEEARRAPGYLPLADRESFRHSTTMVDKAGQRMRNVEKKSAGMAAKVEQAPASAEKNRVAYEKALAEARSQFPKTQQEHFARFLSGCSLDNDACAVQGAAPAAAEEQATKTPAVALGEVDGVVIELPEDADQETKDLWQQH